MKTTFTVSHIKENNVMKTHFQDRVSGLDKYLKRFKNELIHLHGALDKNPHRDEFYASLSLYLPSVVLHCREKGIDSISAMNSAFSDIVRQITKRKDKMGRERRRGINKNQVEEQVDEQVEFK